MNTNLNIVLNNNIEQTNILKGSNLTLKKEDNSSKITDDFFKAFIQKNNEEINNSNNLNFPDNNNNDNETNKEDNNNTNNIKEKLEQFETQNGR